MFHHSFQSEEVSIKWDEVLILLGSAYPSDDCNATREINPFAVVATENAGPIPCSRSFIRHSYNKQKLLIFLGVLNAAVGKPEVFSTPL
jgi:hypothetical protein